MTTGRKIERINFVEYNAKLNTLAVTKVFPKYGTPLLATILRDRGYDVRIYLDGVSDMRFETLADCDLVCLPVFAPNYNKVRAFVERLRQSSPHVPVILGGPHAILYPETLDGMGDYVVRCEGDEVLPELVDCLRDGGDPCRVKGINFWVEGEPVQTADREPPAIPETIPSMSLIQGFDRVLTGADRFRAIQNTLQTSRGCTYRCRFCPTPKLFGDKFRNRSPESVIAEIRHKQRYNDLFFVVDNNFFGDRERAVELLHRIVAEDLHARFIVFARQEIGRDHDLLALMRRAGVACLIVGVESLVDDNLKAFDKQQRVRDVIRSVEQIKQGGIHVIATFAFGYDGDTPAKAKEVVHFARSRGLALNVFLLHDTEYDETKKLLIPLQRRFVTHYQRRAPSDTSYYDYATGNFVTYFPAHMKPSTMQRTFLDIYKELYTERHILKSVFASSAFESVFGITHGYAIRRLNEAMERVVDGHYMAHLERLEQGLYDERERLREDRLAELDGLPLPPPLQEQVDLERYNTLTDLAALPGAARYLAQKARWRLRRSVLRLATFGISAARS